MCLLFASGGLASCAGEQPDSDTSVVTSASADTENFDETTAGPVEEQPELPDIKFDGYSIRFLVRGEEWTDWQSQDIVAEEQNGEPVNDAVYERNIFLEEKYDIKITESHAPKKTTTDIADAAVLAINAGDAMYDVLMGSTLESAKKLAAPGYLTDLNNVPYLDVSRSWWDHRSVEQLTIAQKRFFMTGDLSIMANDATWILLFNKEMYEAFGFENPYDMVLENRWTFDSMRELLEDASADINGDGVISPLDDRLGLATHTSSIEGFFFASGANIVTKDEDDIPHFNMNNERLTKVIEKSTQIMADPNITLDIYNNKFGLKDPTKDLRPVFAEGRALFFGEVLQSLIRFRALEADFGVLPFPKLDESQDEFNHFIHTTAAMVSIPITNIELERTGIILEAMAAKSKYTLRPAYYLLCLEDKFVRDEESKEMLDIIISTRNYDVGYIYDWGGLFPAYRNCISKATYDFISSYASLETKAITEMENTVEMWMELE